MAFIDELKKGISATGQTVVQKTKEISETVQMKAQLNSEKNALTKSYASIGKQVFEAAKCEDAEKYESEFSAIQKSLDKIKELEKQLTEMDGCIFCGECGARIEKNSVFCNRCGAKIVKNKESDSNEVSEDDFVDEIKEEIVEFVEEITE